jgi:hypothetical protein
MSVGWDYVWTVATDRPIIYPPGDILAPKTLVEWYQ